MADPSETSRPAQRRAARAALWLTSSTLLLGVGFLGYVYLASRVAAGGLADAEIARMQQGLVLYARIVLVKGLLPQLWLAFALWPLVRRAIGPRRPLTLCGGLVASAGLAGLVVVSFALPAPLPGLPAVKFTGIWNAVSTYFEATAGVSAALVLPFWWLERASGRRAPLLRGR